MALGGDSECCRVSWGLWSEMDQWLIHWSLQDLVYHLKTWHRSTLDLPGKGGSRWVAKQQRPAFPIVLPEPRFLSWWKAPPGDLMHLPKEWISQKHHLKQELIWIQTTCVYPAALTLQLSGDGHQVKLDYLKGSFRWTLQLPFMGVN